MPQRIVCEFKIKETYNRIPSYDRLKLIIPCDTVRFITIAIHSSETNVTQECLQL